MYPFTKSVISLENAKKIFFFLLIIFGTILLGRYIGSHDLMNVILGERLTGLNINLADPKMLFAVIRRVFILAMVGGVFLLIGKAIYMRNIDELMSIFIVSLPILLHIQIKTPFIYADAKENITSLNLTSIFLVFIFSILAIRRWVWVRYALNNSIVQALCVICILGLFTQIYYLGLFKGVLIVYIRVLQPILFVILISYVSNSRPGLKKYFGVIVLSILVAIVYGMLTEISGAVDTTYDRRPGLIGSWTIYATILVSTISMLLCLIGALKGLEKKIFLLALIPLIIREVLLTQTRSAMVAIAALVFFVFERKFRVLILVVFILSIYMLEFGDFNLNPIEFSQGRFLTFDIKALGQDRNWVIRVSRNAEALQYIIDYPFQGLGLGQPTAETGPELAYWTYNTYLAWGISFGILAMLAFAFLMAKSFVDAIYNYVREKPNERIFQLGLFISLTIWILNQFFTGDSLTYLQPIESTFYFYTIIGMIIGQKYMLDHDQAPSRVT